MNAALRAAALLCLGLPLPVAHAQPASLSDAAFAQTLNAAQLERLYLLCDRASSRGRLATHQAMQCSIVQEELKQRVFGGDFERMLAWWRQQRDAGATPTASPAPP